MLGYSSPNSIGGDGDRVFGIYEFVPEKVEHTDPTIIDPAYLEDPLLKNKRGRFRWPFGLRAVRAWELPDSMRTSEDLPEARSYSISQATNSMTEIALQDRERIQRNPLRQVPVFNVAFDPPKVLRDPNSLPDRNYLLVCRDVNVLRRLPKWQEGEFLYKLGIESETGSRCQDFNDHAVARIFGLRLEAIWGAPAASPSVAKRRERAMIREAVATLGCRLAGDDQQEFLLGPADVLECIKSLGQPA